MQFHTVHIFSWFHTWAHPLLFTRKQQQPPSHLSSNTISIQKCTQKWLGLTARGGSWGSLFSYPSHLNGIHIFFMASGLRGRACYYIFTTNNAPPSSISTSSSSERRRRRCKNTEGEKLKNEGKWKRIEIWRGGFRREESDRWLGLFM